MARRGLTDVTKIRTCPLTAGSFGDEQGRRMVHVLAFVQADPHDYAWSHPVDGVAAYLDLVERRVFQVVDDFERPVPPESGDYDDPAVRGPLRTGLRPIEITQPEGPSFTLDGTSLRWQNWSMRIGFDAREGLTLHQISIADGDDERPLIYRASVPEMVVPYGDPGVPVLAGLLRLGRVPRRQVGELARAGLRLPRRDQVPGRDDSRRLR